jgi:hypothetical protein
MNDAGAQGKVSAEVLGKRGFPGVAYTPEAKLAPGTVGKTVDQNWRRTLLTKAP